MRGEGDLELRRTPEDPATQYRSLQLRWWLHPGFPVPTPASIGKKGKAPRLFQRVTSFHIPGKLMKTTCDWPFDTAVPILKGLRTAEAP